MKVLRTLLILMAVGLFTYSCSPIDSDVVPQLNELPDLNTENGSDGKVGPPPPPPSGG